jgi:hypothetical protein
MGHLGASQARNCQRQTAYLLLAEMSRAPINPQVRSKRDDRQKKATPVELEQAGAATAKILPRGAFP